MGFLKDRIWAWGYVLDKVPSAAPFTFEKSRCSLETQAAYIGAKKAFYNNSMFSREHIEKNFASWDREILENCIDNRLTPFQMDRLKNIDEVFQIMMEEIYKKAENNNINVAWSNEAFELWYLYHFHNRTTQMSRNDYKKAISIRLEEFEKANCKFADHALDDGFFEGDTDGARRTILTQLAGDE